MQYLIEETEKVIHVTATARSGWLLEAVRDAQDNKQTIPTELLQELSRNLFSSGTSPDADLHPQGASELLAHGLKSLSVTSSDGSKVKATRK